MSRVRLKVDVSGTLGHEAWLQLRHFDQVQASAFGPQYGSSGECQHPLDQPHPRGEWIGGVVKLADPLMAQYAVSHYLEQERILDADVE